MLGPVVVGEDNIKLACPQHCEPRKVSSKSHHLRGNFGLPTWFDIPSKRSWNMDDL